MTLAEILAETANPRSSARLSRMTVDHHLKAVNELIQELEAKAKIPLPTPSKR
jgi:hypothetical protein